MTENFKNAFYIEEFERVIEGKAELSENANRVLFWAYRDSLCNKNNLIDFERIDSRDIEEIVKTLKENGINEFTISSEFSGLIQTLADFESHGCKVCGLTNVISNCGGKTVPA